MNSTFNYFLRSDWSVFKDYFSLSSHKYMKNFEYVFASVNWCHISKNVNDKKAKWSVTAVSVYTSMLILSH